jgi:beta-galactosidase
MSVPEFESGSSFESQARDLPKGARFPWIADGLAFGGDYSPEQWPEEVWQEDIALMREAGVNSLNVGVFSWGLLEVADGEFDFGWLDRILDLLAENEIGVNLATPTAAPPLWLHRAYPEILPVSATGIRLGQGGRLGWYPSSQVFRRYSLRMVETLARRYARHPALKMWHVSNELGNENGRSYDDETGQAFRDWLETRFGSIEVLNEAWGTAFWGHHYTSFAQVDPPRFTGTSHNPALLLDFERFSSDALLSYYENERDVLRQITPDVPVTTNFMIQSQPGVANYARWASEVDVVANDHYTIGVDPERHGELAFSADRTRGIAGGEPWLLIEHSTSAVNWQPRNRAKSRGELLRNSLAHVARGADGVLFFQWRQSSAGSEQFHSAVVPHAGRDTKVFREAVELGRILRTLAPLRGSRVQRARVAMLFDEDSAAALRSGAKPTVELSALDVPLAFHRELTARGVAVDMLPPSADLDGYAIIIVPTLFLVSDADAARISDAASAGAHVVVTAFSGIVTPQNRVRLGGYPGAFRDLLGVRFEEVYPLLEGEVLTLANGWTAFGWSELGEVTTASVITAYSDGELAGSPAITRNFVGSGSAIYVSTWLDRRAVGDLLDSMLAETGVAPVADGTHGLERVRRLGEDGSSWLFALNHGQADAEVSVTGIDVVTGDTVWGRAVVPAGAVAVYREERS